MKKYHSNIKKIYPRNMVGYGSKGPKVEWPNNARIALQIVLNYEEGAENCVLHGDKHSEVFLSEIIGAQPIKGRHINMESLYEFGSRRGFWRLHELFQERKIPITIFGVGMALERNKDVCNAIKESNYEIASHGWRWIDYQKIPKATEKKHMQLAINSIKKYLVVDLWDGTRAVVVQILETWLWKMEDFSTKAILIAMTYPTGKLKVKRNN